MKLTNIKPAYLIGGAAVLALAYVYFRGAKSAGADIGGAVVDLATGVLSGAAQAGGSAVAEAAQQAGEVIGLPRTSQTACQRSIAEFRAAPWYRQALLGFTVSANCPASDYLRFVTTGRGPGE